MDSVPQKTCSKCGQPKPITQFGKRASSKDGHAHWCKACQSAYDRRPERKATKRDRIKERRKIDPEFRDKLRERTRSRYATDPMYQQATRQRVAIWQRAFRERVNEAQRRRYQSGYGLIDRARKNNPIYKRRKYELEKRRLETNPEYFARHRARLRAYKHRRRSWIEQRKEHYTQQEWEQLCQQYDHRCLRCGEKKPLTADHVMPLSLGGSNAISNIQPLCLDCNRQKGATFVDYRPAPPYAVGEKKLGPKPT